MDIQIGRATETTEGSILNCPNCSKGSLVVERRRGCVIRSVCTNPRCARNPNCLNNIEDIAKLIKEWRLIVSAANITHGLNDKLTESLAEYLYSNL